MMGWMDAVPLWDHHCHALLREEERDNLEALARCLTEAPLDYPLRDIKKTVVYQEALAVAAQELGTQPEEEPLRRALRAADYRAYCRRLFQNAGYGRLYIDTGYTPEQAWSLTELQEVLGISVYPILRLETTAEWCFRQSGSFEEWRTLFIQQVSQARQSGYRGAKSIVAYRSGLHIMPVDEGTASRRWEEMRQLGQQRLQQAELLNYLVHLATPLLIQQQLPLQFHTGYGDPDTDLLQGNPLLLRVYLETYAQQDHRVVLLHTYPYQREAGYLTSVYRGVYADVSLALPLAASGAVRILHELLELAPLSRVLFASDSHSRPESYALAGQFFREGMDQFLSRVVGAHQVRASVAADWAEAVSFRNAEALYGT